MLQYNLFGIGYIYSQEYDYYMKQCAARLGMDWRHLDTYCFIENARKLDDTNGNQYRGMLQWGNAAAQSLGYSSAAQIVAQNPTYEKQFQIVEKWIRLLWKQHGKRTEAGYLYLCHFLPVNAPHYADKSYILRGEKGRLVKRGYDYYDQNSGIDFNKDGMITVGDVDNFVYSKSKLAGHNLGNPPQDSPPIKSDTYGQIAQIAQIFAIGAIIVAITNEF